MTCVKSEARLERWLEILSRPLDNVRTWPRWARLTYLFLLPIAWPLHMLYCVAFVVAALIVFTILSLVLMAYEVYRGGPNEWSA